MIPMRDGFAECRTTAEFAVVAIKKPAVAGY
nr:MAG TPA: hypothetical protein [Caudoviricetes sp.]